MNKNIFPQFNSKTPGYSAVVSKKGEIIFSENAGLADLKNKTLITSNTAFRLASLTKPFTAMAIMILYEMRLLRFDDNLSKFFPDFPKYGKQITIRELLSHTSGLPDHEKSLYDENETYGEPTIYDSFEILKKQKGLLFKSGMKFEYSNSGCVLLALIIEKVSGRKYSDFLQKNIFTPLKLKNTTVVDETKPFIKYRAYGYKKKKDKFIDHDYDPLNYIIGDEGIYSSVLDLVCWSKAWQESILVKKETLDIALKPQKLVGNKFGECGFSWFIKKINGRKCFFHAGTWVGFSNIILTEFDTGITAILLSNGSGFQTEKMKINAVLKLMNSL